MVDRFGEFGDVKNVQMNLDRRTGFVKARSLQITADIYFAWMCVGKGVGGRG